MLHNSAKGPLILVADDSRDVRRNLQKLLEYHGCRVCTADDGQGALEAIRRHPPDLVLLDVNMPRLDGLATVRLLKADRDVGHIPVILLTALSGAESLLHGLDAGADEFLSKPVDEPELLARVRSLLRIKQQHDRLRDYQDHLAQLLRISEQLLTRLEPHQLLSAIVELATQHLGFRRCIVTVLDPQTGILKVGAVAGVSDRKTVTALTRTTYRWAAVQALLRPEYRISESYLIPDETPVRNRRNGHKPATPVGNEWRPQDNLLVPLRATGGTLYGFLSFDTPDDGLRPGVEQIQLLELFAHQAAAAMQNAHLYADLHQQYARYVGPVVAAQLTARTAAGPPAPPVEQDLVVLFSDLRGFTALSEGLSPQELVNEVLNPYFSHMTDVIVAYDGMVDKFLGDGIMALFGVPQRRGDEAARAITAALAMQEAFQPLQAEWHARLGRDIGMGIGLASGKAIVGSIGSTHRTDYTAIGSVVNLASRVTDLTPTGQVWATAELKLLAETYLLAHPDAGPRYPITFRPLMPTTIKGTSGMQSLYVCLVNR
ncbi:MAG TPA: response regulator [Chloroflexia bacterium]